MRCGDLGCRCAHGQPHVAYYRSWREGGKLRKSYVKRSDLVAVRAACEARRLAVRELSEGWGRWWKLVTVVHEVAS